ncbi:MAG: hypothetical protein AB7V27_07015 [Candidatus Binatia bacterium]
MPLTASARSYRRHRLPPALVVALSAALSLATAARATCTGDCDGDRRVSVNEPIMGVNIWLGRLPLGACAALDADGDDNAGVNELIAAVRNALNGCALEPTATADPAASATATAAVSASATAGWSPSSTGTATLLYTPTPTPTAAVVNDPPIVPTAFIYRGYPGFAVRLPIDAVDPEGGAARCFAAELPAGASFDPQIRILSWTPAAEPIGPFYVPFSCVDDADPPAASAGQLIFKIAALDGCAMPVCDPATGCRAELPPLSRRCCAAGPAARVAEPRTGCPASRVLFVGQNTTAGSFGRLQNCDVLRVRNFLQSGAEVQLHIEARCVNAAAPVQVHARLESGSPAHRVVFDAQVPGIVLTPGADGFARRRNIRFTVQGGGPFRDLEGAEASLTVTLTDADRLALTERLRLRLSFTPQPDRPNLDPTPAPAGS